MLIHSVLQGAHYRRAHPLQVSSSVFAAQDIYYGMMLSFGNYYTVTGFYVDPVFDGREDYNVALSSSVGNDYITDDIDTTFWIQWNWFNPVKVTELCPLNHRGHPTAIVLKGSNDYEFSESTTLLTQELDGENAAYGVWDSWYSLSPVQAYKFLRMYFIGPFNYRTGQSSQGGMAEVKFKITDDTIAAADVYRVRQGYADHFYLTVTAQSGATPAYAFNYTLSSAWRASYAAINAEGGCWLQINTGSDTQRLNIAKFAIQQGQTSQYYGQGAPGYYSLKASNTGAFSGEETTIINNQLFDYGNMSSTNLCLSPWVEFTAPGLFRYYRWYFYSWTNLDHGFDVVPGIGKFYLVYHKETS